MFFCLARTSGFQRGKWINYKHNVGLKICATSRRISHQLQLKKKVVPGKANGYLPFIIGHTGTTAMLSDFRILPRKRETKADDRDEIPQL